MKLNNRPHLGLDSQCLSYLLDSIENIDKPSDSLADEKIALLRTWFYNNSTFILTETVISEVRRIRDITRREFHESYIRTLFLDYKVHDRDTVQAKAIQFNQYHPGHSDCLILAEAEELKLDFVLTYDHDFWKSLSDVPNTTKLMKPSEYWINLNISKGEKPVTVPHHTNPLCEQTWWRW
jgi:hypothetical protein